MTLINTASCNAMKLASCPHVPPQVVTGSGPIAAALDPANHAIYVPNYYYSTVSIIGTADPTGASR